MMPVTQPTLPGEAGALHSELHFVVAGAAPRMACTRPSTTGSRARVRSAPFEAGLPGHRDVALGLLGVVQEQDGMPEGVGAVFDHLKLSSPVVLGLCVLLPRSRASMNWTIVRGDDLRLLEDRPVASDIAAGADAVGFLGATGAQSREVVGCPLWGRRSPPRQAADRRQRGRQRPLAVLRHGLVDQAPHDHAVLDRVQATPADQLADLRLDRVHCAAHAPDVTRRSASRRPAVDGRSHTELRRSPLVGSAPARSARGISSPASLHGIDYTTTKERKLVPPLPEVAVLSLGGTITMEVPPGASASTGVRPAADGAAIVAAVPQLERVAQIRRRTLASLPSASLAFSDLLDCLAAAREEVAKGAAGVVVVQGTDTLEESAYLLDLLWDQPEPLVVTGAMRHPGQASPDGPGNLVAASAVAGSSHARSQGVLVVMDDEIHAARYVMKRHSRATGAFRSEHGPIGRLQELEPTFFLRLPRRPPISPPRPGVEPEILVIPSTLGDNASLLRQISKLTYDGIVLATFGVGHVADVAADLVGALTPQVPVIFASRTGTGGTSARTYGFPGSEIDLLERGAIGAGSLDPFKARVLLWALLAAGAATPDIAGAFATHGSPAWT